MKRLLCCLCALSLLLTALPALGEQETTLPRMAELNDLLDACADVSDALQMTILSPQNADMPAAACLIVSRLLGRGQLAGFTVENGQATLSRTALSELYEQLFDGSVALPSFGMAGLLSMTETDFVFDCALPTASTAGMQIMLAEGDEDGDVQSLMLELYRVPGAWVPDAQETLLGADWFGSALAQVRRRDDSPLGWQLVSWGPADDLEQTALSSQDEEELLCWFTDEAEQFSVQYPAFFAAEDVTVTAEGFHAELAGENVTFDVRASAEQSTLAQVAASSEGAHPGAQVTLHQDQQYFTVLWEGSGVTHYEAVYVSGGMRYTAAFTYPTEQMERYAAYAAYMENSFTLLTLSVG